MNQTSSPPLGRILAGTILLFVTVYFCFSAGWKTTAALMIAIPAGFALILPVQQASQFLLYYLAMCFVVADRTIYVGDYYRIYPQEVILFLLFPYVAFTQWKTPDKTLVPLSGKLLAVFTIIGVMTAVNYQQPVDLAVFFAKGVLFFVPLFFCVRRVVTSERVLQNVCLFLVVSTAVACAMSIADYHGLGIAKGVFGETEKDVLVDVRLEDIYAFENPFHRIKGLHLFVTFTAASVYLTLFISFYLYHAIKDQKLRLFLRLAQLSFLAYIFYSGYRSVWIALAVSFAVYGIQRGAKGVVGFALAGFLIISVLPAGATDRLRGLGISSEAERDSSVQKRIERAEGAMEIIREKTLFGTGWGSAGLVHNEFLQIAADSGIFTVIAFVVFYGGILARLYRRYWQSVRQGHRLESHCMNVFFCALGGYLFVLFTGSHFNTQHTFIVFWLTLALAAKITNLPIGESAGTSVSRQVSPAVPTG